MTLKRNPLKKPIHLMFPSVTSKLLTNSFGYLLLPFPKMNTTYMKTLRIDRIIFQIILIMKKLHPSLFIEMEEVSHATNSHKFYYTIPKKKPTKEYLKKI